MQLKPPSKQKEDAVMKLLLKLLALKKMAPSLFPQISTSFG